MPEASRLHTTSYANYLEISVRNASATILYCSGRHCFKCLISKEEISSNFWTVTLNHLFLQTLRVACGFNILVILICFVLELPELLSTMYLLVNTDSGSFLRRIFHVLAVYTLLNLSDISCMIVEDLTITGIQEEIQLVTLSYFLNSTVELFHSKKTLLYCQFPFLHK